MKTSKKDFVAEAEEIIESANNYLLELQSSFTPDTLNSLFRAFHTMKGLAGLFGLQSVTDLSHALESVLDDLRLGKIEFSGDAISFLFSNLDILKNLIIQVSEDKELDDVTGAIQDVASFREKSKEKSKDLPLEDIGVSLSILKVLSEYESHRLKSNVKEGKGLYLVKSVFSLENFATELGTLNSNLKELGEIIATLPNSEGIPQGSIGFNLLFGSFSRADEIKSKAGAPDIEEISSPKVPDAPGTEPQAAKPQETSLKSSTNTVRVDIGKLDKILDTVGELVLAKGAVIRIGRELAETIGFANFTIDIHKISQTLETKLAELQDQILELRMVPFSQIFTRLSQVVRRYTREIGKEIDLKLFGEDTEIDKLLAEEIIDPLIHIIRNAIDHGIEPKDKRVALGKNEAGTITLKAFPEGNNVMVTIQDDGAGLDADKIYQKAVELKLIPEDQLFEDKERFDLIFLPGLSTKEEVSEVSGRGVGMDIVKQKITASGGFVSLESEKGAGTTFFLTLPMTLAIIKTLIVHVADEKFVVPLTSISETFTVLSEKIQTIEGREVIEMRGEMLPLLRIARVFQLKEKPKDELYAVIVGFGGKKLGLLVDGLEEQTETIIRPLGEHLKDIKGFSGATEVGRHEIVLALDVEAMIEETFSGKKITNAAPNT